MQTLNDKTSHLIMYCLELCLDPKKGYQDFGKAMKVELEDLRFHLVLPGLLDVNLCMDKVNRSFGPRWGLAKLGCWSEFVLVWQGGLVEIQKPPKVWSCSFFIPSGVQGVGASIKNPILPPPLIPPPSGGG